MHEDTPEFIEPLLEMVSQKAEQVTKNIDQRLQSPIDQSAESAINLSTKEQLNAVFKEYLHKSAHRTWSSAKAVAAGAFSLIPILGGAGEVSSALVDAAKIEGATQKQAEVLSKGAVVTNSGEVADPLLKILGKESAGKVKKIVKKLDPFEDVHPAIVAAFGAAELAGLEGAGAIPAAIQLSINQIELIKDNFRMAAKAKDIIINSPEAAHIKAMAADTMGTIRKRFDIAASPKMASAAKLFTQQ